MNLQTATLPPADTSPYWLAGLIFAAALLVILTLLLGTHRNEGPHH
ncbi:hypothetical protein [Tepidiforma sp.]|nr:hypothetical protein [Tepidiforma sp.]